MNIVFAVMVDQFDRDALERFLGAPSHAEQEAEEALLAQLR